MGRHPVSVVAAATFVWAGSAIAGEPSSVGVCAAAYEEAQRHRARGALLEAREHAALCANPGCPNDMLGVCASITSDLEAAIPTNRSVGDSGGAAEDSPFWVPVIVSFSAAGAGLFLGAVAGGIALSQDAALADNPNRLESLEVGATAGFVIGGLGLATGLVLVFVSTTTGPDDSSTSVVVPTADGLIVRF